MSTVMDFADDEDSAFAFKVVRGGRWAGAWEVTREGLALVVLQPEQVKAWLDFWRKMLGCGPMPPGSAGILIEAITGLEEVRCLLALQERVKLEVAKNRYC